MLQAKPGAFARLGQGGAEGGCFLHNSTYDFNDEVIPLGAGYLAALAEPAMPLACVTSPPAPWIPMPHFSQSYAEARAKFLAAAAARAIWTVESHALPGLRGVDGEALAMDVALLGDRTRRACWC